MADPIAALAVLPLIVWEGREVMRGKAYSRRNAFKHGLLINGVLFSSDGTPINAELHDLWDSLQAKYGSDDVGTELLLETLVVEW